MIETTKPILVLSFKFKNITLIRSKEITQNLTELSNTQICYSRPHLKTSFPYSLSIVYHSHFLYKYFTYYLNHGPF